MGEVAGGAWAWRPEAEQYGQELLRRTKGMRGIAPGSVESYDGTFLGGKLHPDEWSLTVLFHGPGYLQHVHVLANPQASVRLLRVNLGESIQEVNGRMRQREQAEKIVAFRGVLSQGQSAVAVPQPGRAEQSRTAGRENELLALQPSEVETLQPETAQPTETESKMPKKKSRVALRGQGRRSAGRSGGLSPRVTAFAQWLLKQGDTNETTRRIVGLHGKAEAAFPSGDYFLEKLAKRGAVTVIGKEGKQSVYEVRSDVLQGLLQGATPAPATAALPARLRGAKTPSQPPKGATDEHLATLKIANAALRKLTDEEREAFRKLPAAIAHLTMIGFNVTERQGVYVLEL